MDQQILLPLNNMTVAQKLEVIEQVWADLRRSSQTIPMPDWHKELLESRQKSLQRREISYTDWETAKLEIKQRVG